MTKNDIYFVFEFNSLASVGHVSSVCEYSRVKYLLKINFWEEKY